MLLAVREYEIYAQDEDGAFLYNFKKMNYSVKQYKIFMRKTGLFDMIAKHLVNNLVDYALGIETGLDSNGRKNRGGHQMEDLVEKYIKVAGTDGIGWKSARGNLRETFEVMDIYSINDMENGAMQSIFI